MRSSSRSTRLLASLSLASAAVGATTTRAAHAQPPAPPGAPAPLPGGPPPGGPPDIERIVVTRGPGAPQRARSALGLWLGAADSLGVRLDRVAADGPAAKAGIAAGERIVAVNGTSLRVDRADTDDPFLTSVPVHRLERAVGRLAPGTEVELRVVGPNGKERSVRVRTVAPTTLADAGPGSNIEIRRFTGPGAFGPGFGPGGAPGADESARVEIRRRMTGFADSARARAAQRPALGMTLAPSTSPRDTLGLFVASVVTGGPAERAGVVEGDRVAAINSVDLRTPREERDDPQAAEARRSRFVRELERARVGDHVTLRVWGDGRWRTVTATVARSADVYAAGGDGRTFRFEFGPGMGADVAPRPFAPLRPLSPPFPPRPVAPLRRSLPV